jgi:hypothetical protein
MVPEGIRTFVSHPPPFAAALRGIVRNQTATGHRPMLEGIVLAASRRGFAIDHA